MKVKGIFRLYRLCCGQRDGSVILTFVRRRGPGGHHTLGTVIPDKWHLVRFALALRSNTFSLGTYLDL